MLELAVLVGELREGEHAGICVRGPRLVVRAVRPPEQRQARRLADRLDAGVEHERLGALLLGSLGRLGIVDRDDDRDPVALGDCLAEAPRPGHVP